MTTVREIDRLVVSDDAVAARLWQRLGPKVRDAYLHDRDAWVVLRRGGEGGASLPTATLAAQQKVFLGWARAFRGAAAGRPKRSRHATIVRRKASPAAAAAAAASSTRAIFPPASAASAPLAATAAAAVTKAKGSAGTAVAGGLVLAGLIAVAAKRKRP